jgi:hypothetical protein
MPHLRSRACRAETGQEGDHDLPGAAVGSGGSARSCRRGVSRLNRSGWFSDLTTNGVSYPNFADLCTRKGMRSLHHAGTQTQVVCPSLEDMRATYV